MNLDAGALIQQTIEDMGAVVADARDEAETCDYDAPLRCHKIREGEKPDSMLRIVAETSARFW
jgi:hypothetical protein